MYRQLVPLLSLLLVAPIAEAGIAGCWIPESGDAVVALETRDGRVTGRIVGMEDPVFTAEEGLGTPGEARRDLNNPEPALRTRLMAGLAIVADLEQDGDVWKNGSIYDPESGNTYSARAEVDRDGLLRLRGYVGTPLFGRTTKWTPAAARPEAVARMLGKTRPWLPSDLPPPSC